MGYNSSTAGTGGPEPVCRDWKAMQASFSSMPFFCDGVIVASTDWRSVLCYPTWDYSPMQLAVVFMLLFFLRLYARKYFRILHRRQHHGEEPHPEVAAETQDSCCVPLMARKARSSGNFARRKAPSNSTFQRCSRKAWECLVAVLLWLWGTTYDMVKRTLLQVLQWWVVMIAMLLYLLLGCMLEANKLYGISVEMQNGQGRGVTLVTSPEFAEAVPPWLKNFSVWSFGAVFLTFGLTLLSIILQVITHCSLHCNMFATGSAMITLPRDVAIQVLLLPMVYSLLAAKNVLAMWSNMTGNFDLSVGCFGRSKEESKDLLRETFETNFALADMYEAWALYCFGQMVAKVLQPDLRKKIRLDVVVAFESLLLIDVSVFVFVCAIGADYTIILTWCKWRLGIDICKTFPFVCSFKSYLAGANWCSSSIAIYNLFTVEHKFGLLNTMINFGPNLKFWSIKIMVLVAFWMGLVSVVVRDGWHLTSDESNLLDASFRIYVMTMVAIINLKAWWPWSQWYYNVDEEEHFRLRSRLSFMEKSQPLNEVGVRHVPPGTVKLVAELFPVISPDEARNWQKVEAKIRELDEASINNALWQGSQIGWAVTGYTSTTKETDRQGGRRAMMELSAEKRKEQLLAHLQGFYPEF